MKGICIAVLASIFVSLCLAYEIKAPIGQIPGYSGPEITQYTGYTNIGNGGDYRFWWLVESTGNSSTDPLVIWFQGGPGCSGLYGLFAENGPYRVNATGGVEYNDLSWTTIANVLFIEQPTGVGFSYSDNSSNYATNDFKSADDNFKFVELWLQENPAYIGRPTWLAGESYGGVYIPSLTSLIVQNPSSQIYQQLTGLTLGNPVISCVTANYDAIQMDLFYYHALVSYTNYYNWTANNCAFQPYTSEIICQAIMNTTLQQMGVIFQQKRDLMTNEPSLDPDDLYQDFCTGNGTLDFAVNQGYPEDCHPVGDDLTTYLNRADVQEFIGAKAGSWDSCSNIDYTISGDSMIPHYRTFFAKRPDLDILLYSGDVDVYTVPFGYTAACLHELSEEASQVWGPWFVNGATAGYFEQYEHYSYATLKGAGHESPQYQPLTSLELFKRFTTTGTVTAGQPRYPSPRPTQARVLKQYGIIG